MLIFTLVAAVATAQAASPQFGGKRGVQTMNANLYIGAGTGRILALDPTDPDYLTQLVGAVTGVYYEILASQPPVRIAAVADEIAARQPDLVAVQEATLLCNQSPGDLVTGGTSPATNVVYDYLQILVEALAARGAHYAVASTAQEWDVEMPMMNLQTGTFDDVRQTDRDAILVRTDLPPGHLRVTNPLSGNFTNALQFPAIGLSVVRGWCSVFGGRICARREIPLRLRSYRRGNLTGDPVAPGGGTDGQLGQRLPASHPVGRFQQRSAPSHGNGDV